LQASYAKRLFLTANVREDDNDSFGQHMTYRVAPAVILPFTDTTIKGELRHRLQAADAEPVVPELSRFQLLCQSEPEARAKPRRRHRLRTTPVNDRIRFGSTYFKNNITDLINANNTFTTNINIGNAITKGTESFVTASIIDRVKVRADYTVTRAVDADTGLQLSAPAKGEIQRHDDLESDRSAHALATVSSRTATGSTSTVQAIQATSFEAGLHCRQPQSRLCDQRPTQGVWPDRQPR